MDAQGFFHFSVIQLIIAFFLINLQHYFPLTIIPHCLFTALALELFRTLSFAGIF